MLTLQAKRDYQREYTREFGEKRRSVKTLCTEDVSIPPVELRPAYSVRPPVRPGVRPEEEARGLRELIKSFKG